jgi:hypothetical protein
VADYYPLIARAVAGLPQNTGEARHALYDRARNALVAQVHGQAPTLNESELTRERRALDDAIRKVEIEASAQSPFERPMTKANLLQCSRCGGDNDVDVRLAVCGATAQWQQNNFPAPNTTVTHYNNIRLWRLALCRSCLPESYRIFLRNHIRRIGGQLVLYALLGVIALFCWFFQVSNALGLTPFLGRLFVFAVVGASLASVIGTPVCAFILLLDWRRLRALGKTSVVPVKRLDKSFVGEGQRIIEALRPHHPSGEKVFGEFQLPLQKTRDKKEMTIDEESQDRRGFGERDIVAVGKNLDDLSKALPEQWRPLWAERKAF